MKINFIPEHHLQNYADIVGRKSGYNLNGVYYWLMTYSRTDIGFDMGGKRLEYRMLWSEEFLQVLGKDEARHKSACCTDCQLFRYRKYYTKYFDNLVRRAR